MGVSRGEGGGEAGFGHGSEVAGGGAYHQISLADGLVPEFDVLRVLGVGHVLVLRSGEGGV